MRTSYGSAYKNRSQQTLSSVLVCRIKMQKFLLSVKHLRMASSYSTSCRDVLLETVQGKGVITLNRPKALNAFNLPMIRRIYQKIEEWDSDASTPLVIIKGAGDKAFCTGGDIKAVADSGRKGDGYTVDLFREGYSLNYRMAVMKKPLVAIVNGIAMGGGIGLCVHGRYRVATERAVFAMPETGIGLFPDAGTGYVLPRMKGQLGVYLGLTGHRLEGKDTLHAGYATHFVESAKVEDLEQALLQLKSPCTEKLNGVLNDFHEKCQIDRDKPFSLASHQEDIDRLFSGDSVEEIFEALHQDGSVWAVRQLETLRKMSPTSLKLCLRLFREGANIDMAGVMKLEYRMSQGCMRGHDFYEGVRALLEDKDRNPRWNPAKVEDVTPEIVDDHCRPLHNDLFL